MKYAHKCQFKVCEYIAKHQNNKNLANTIFCCVGVTYIKVLVGNSKSQVQSPVLYTDTPVSSSIEHVHISCLEHVCKILKFKMEEDGIKVDGKETGCEDVDCIQVTTVQ
jgi:hypothetical protein